MKDEDFGQRKEKEGEKKKIRIRSPTKKKNRKIDKAKEWKV